MTKLFETAVEMARALPPERQDEIARLVLMVAQEDDHLYPQSPEEREVRTQSTDRAPRRPSASDDEVSASWAKLGL